MRNLKRALSLAMASVMLLGMMVVASAEQYPDVTSANNLEAIEVAQLIGVMEGYEDGTFRPEKNVTRNEMAVIMCHLLNLTPGGSHPFNDVPSWAEPYVAACYNNGIIAGVSANQYNGNANVTAVQAGLMTMKALGYFYNQSEFGDSWKLSTIREAQAIDLYRGIDLYNEQDMTRNDVAQLVLNTLEADCRVAKQTNTTTSVQGEGLNITINSPWEYKYVTTNDKHYETNEPNDGYLQLCEKLFGNDLRKDGAVADDFGRPSHKWTYLSKSVTAPDAADLTYTKDVKLKDIYSDLGKPTNATNVYAYAVDGKVQTAPVLKDNSNKIGAKGAVLEVYIDRAKGEVTAIEITNYLVKAAEDYDADNEELDVNEATGALTGVDMTLKAEDFPVIANVKEDDYLVVTVAGTEIKSVAPATVVSEVKVSAYKVNDSVTAGGTKYEYAKVASADANIIDGDFVKPSAAFSLQDTTYDLFLDANGYALGVKAHDGDAKVSDYLFVTDAGAFVGDVTAKVVFMDGTDKSVTVSKVDGTKGATPALTKFFSFKVDKNGKYELTSTTAQEAQSNGTDTNKKSTGLVVDGSTKVANNATVFVADDKVYTGVKNTPKIATGSKVYVLYDADGYIMAAYSPVAGKSSTDASEFVYILKTGAGTFTEAKDADDNNYYVYDAVVKGTKGTLNVAATIATAPGVYEITSYTDGYADVDGATGLGDRFDVYTATNTQISYKDGVVKVNGNTHALAADAKLYKIDSTDSNKTTTLSAGALNSLKAANYYVWYVTVSDSDDAVATLYVVQY